MSETYPNQRELVEEASHVWAQYFPRQVVDENRRQFSVSTRDQLVNALMAVNGRGSAYFSVYCFPRGHSKEGNIPDVDTIMYDLDVHDAKNYEQGDIAAWRRDISGLLARARVVAKHLIESGLSEGWRASLSGFKGIHLYQDFPTLDPANGSQGQFKGGIRKYTKNLIARIEDETNIELAEWIDVDSSDLGRLTRHPNTIHVGATEFFGEQRYCVPVSLEELSTIGPGEYQELTRQPRPVPWSERHPRQQAADVLTQHIRDSAGRSTATLSQNPSARVSLTEYDEIANDRMTTLADVRFVLRNKPCIIDWAKRPDAFGHGEASHSMEFYAIMELLHKRVPVDLIVEFFSEIEGFDEAFTRDRIQKILSWDDGSRRPLNHEFIEEHSPQFVLTEECHLYLQNHE